MAAGPDSARPGFHPDVVAGAAFLRLGSPAVFRRTVPGSQGSGAAVTATAAEERYRECRGGGSQGPRGGGQDRLQGTGRGRRRRLTATQGAIQGTAPSSPANGAGRPGTPRSYGSTFPGFMIPRGSSAALIRCIK